MKHIMMGHYGELFFYYSNDGLSFVSLEIISHWDPYTPKMELGKDYFIS